MNKRITRFISIFIGTVIAIGLLTGTAQVVYGAAGEGNDPTDVPSNPSAGSKVFSKSRGASWVKYPVNGNNNIVIGPQKASGQVALGGGTLHGCVDDGAEYYYRLAYNWYKKGTNTEWYADQTKGVLAVRNLAVDDQNGTVPVVKPDVWGENAIDYPTAKKYFEKTIAAGMNDGLVWDDVGMFCWSEKLLCQPGDPYYPTCVPPAPQTFNAHFWADSTVSASPEYAGTISAKSDAEDKKAYITFSVDQPSVDVTFSHNLHYVLDNQPTPAHNSDTWSGSDTFTEDVYTDWSVSGASSSSDTWSITGTTPKSNTDLTNIAETTVTVNLGLNETKTVCQKIEYKPKYYTFKTVLDHEHEETEHHDVNNADGSINHDADVKYWVHDYWDWGVDTSSGSAYSEACAIIYRPPDSIPDDPYDPGDAGNDDTEKMYAGEDTKMEWDTYGETAPTRRLINWKSILYLVKENVGYGQNNDTIKGYSHGNNRTTDPCTYYTGKVGSYYYCKDFESGSVSHSDATNLEDHDYYRNPSFAVADYVGAKFCMSFGYQYEYWYGTSTNYSGTFSWTGPYHSYWRTYDARCKTIAKKPSSAIWNGSLMTNGGIYTPLVAPRHTDTTMNSEWKISTDLSNYKLYGSWTEHLDVIGKNVNNHGSGSKMYNGGIVGICNDVDLTIANATCSGNGNGLGGSGIGNNSAYFTKLTTYLRDDPKISTAFTYMQNSNPSGVGYKSPADIKAALTSNMTGTTIVKYTGDLEISQNITTKSGPYANIYEIPQVIIFVDGNVNITNNVERIDAWLIVSSTTLDNGVVNTCSNFSDKSTPAFVNLLHSATNPPDCSKQLTFNGPVRARKLLLRRSFGADRINLNLTGSPLPNRMSSDRQVPAEIFNLRADTYLWAYAQAGRYDSSYTESYSRELPPRY